MSDPKADKSPLERVTGENDVTPEEERQREAARPGGKSRIQDMAHKVKDAAQEVMGTGKPEASGATQEEKDVLREYRKGSDR
ncbi:hypothetical protein ABZ924_34285 [Streptomyces sp. NPDC046876]|uniref:hypothetical protein n=1 Tax=Streptomyces sp. NPDC046876 TaxID=3155616 RepID=UPI0033C29E55